MSCIFCEIINGNIPSERLHEDDLTLSFLDVRQSNEGHCLIVPKSHAQFLYDLDPQIAGAIMQHTALLSRIVNEVIRPDGIQVWQSNGRAAGQEVDHVHIHLFPRYHGDGHFKIYPEPPAVSSGVDLERIASPIRSALAEAEPNLRS